MKPLAILISAGLLASSLSLPARSADSEGNFALRGFGAQTCGTVIKHLTNGKQTPEAGVAWVLGYATAFNRMQSGTFDVSPIADALPLFNLIIVICRNTPDNRVETVAFDILRALATARVVKSTPIVETRSGETVAQVRQETLLKIQSQLKEIGHMSGKPDGVYGQHTEQALKAFQSAQKLPVTGVADAATVIRLLIELPAEGR